jgi:hypothetical protein
VKDKGETVDDSYSICRDKDSTDIRDVCLNSKPKVFLSFIKYVRCEIKPSFKEIFVIDSNLHQHLYRS